jgi:hypothetical protein
MTRAAAIALALASSALLPCTARAQPSPEPEPTPASISAIGARNDFLGKSRALNGVLAGWAAASIATGAVMTTVSDDPFVQHQGIQHMVWGGVDAILAGIAAIVVSQWSNQRESEGTWIDRRNTNETVFWVNAGLDVAYVATGAILWGAFDDPKLRGAGSGIVLQGSFLLGFDTVAGIVMHYGK